MELKDVTQFGNLFKVKLCFNYLKSPNTDLLAQPTSVRVLIPTGWWDKNMSFHINYWLRAYVTNSAL